MGSVVNVPTRTIKANTSITSGRYDRCNQFPRASSTTAAERDRAISFSCSANNSSKSTSSCRFSLAGSVRRSITSPTAPTTFFTPSKVVKP